MEVDVNYTFNVITILTSCIVWCAIIFFAYRIYTKQIVKPKIWKVIIVIVIGLFSFSIKWTMFNVIMKIPILPLGVWLLYFIFKVKDKSWHTYRAFAWLGFWANFLFLASSFLAMSIHPVIYPKDEPTTYMAHIENASIINIHPSAKDVSLNKESLLNQFHKMSQQTIDSDQWYNDTYMSMESNSINERFPYQLVGTASKWGSGIHTMIFIENDGRGILITTSSGQLYFRSDASLVEEVE